MVILENIDIDIDIDKAILQNIDIDKISNRFKFGISNRATRPSVWPETSSTLGQACNFRIPTWPTIVNIALCFRHSRHFSVTVQDEGL